MIPCSLVHSYQRFRGRFYARNGGSMFLRNVGSHLPDFTMSYLRKNTMQIFRPCENPKSRALVVLSVSAFESASKASERISAFS
jgi:hypothetical protein